MKSIPQQIFESTPPHKRKEKLREWIRKNPREAEIEFARCRRLQSAGAAPRSSGVNVIPPEAVQ